MSIQHETVLRELIEASEHLEKLIHSVKDKNLKDGEFLPELEHIIMHINAAYNKKYMSLDEVLDKSKKEHEWSPYNTPDDLII